MREMEGGATLSPPRSKVEVGTKEARYYDLLLSLISLGVYPRFIRGAIDRMNIQPGQSILDLGSGNRQKRLLDGPQDRLSGLGS